MDNLVVIVLDLIIIVVLINNFCFFEGMRSFFVYVGMFLFGFFVFYLYIC